MRSHPCTLIRFLAVASVTRDVFTASVWVGHGNGKGSLAMTEHYLNKSEKHQEKAAYGWGGVLVKFG
ncbi:hypothetical protein BS049_RS23275 [Vibrio parahaemolyticus]|nr:hypothetical protein [Vibrio parahaemolyticus]